MLGPFAPINLLKMTSSVPRSAESLSSLESLSRITSCIVFLGEFTRSATCFCCMPFRKQKRSRICMPFGVNCHTDPFKVNSFPCFPSADSINRASRNRWQTERAISLAMEKVVVVVVVTILDGSFGSGIRLDCENLRDPRLLIASSERKECSIRVRRTRCTASGRLTTNVENRSLKS